MAQGFLRVQRGAHAKGKRRLPVKVSYIVTLDAPDVPDAEVSAAQVETARAVIQSCVAREVPAGVHVTTCVQRGLPLHPFKPQHPFPTP